VVVEVEEDDDDDDEDDGELPRGNDVDVDVPPVQSPGTGGNVRIGEEEKSHLNGGEILGGGDDADVGLGTSDVVVELIVE